MSVQTPAERWQHDSQQGAHWRVSLLNRWLHGAHAGAVNSKRVHDENADPGNGALPSFPELTA